MSDINITIEAITKIEPCANADKLEVAKILGTQTVVPKGQFKVGQLVVYFPPDVLIPADMSKALGVDKYLKHATFDGQKIACRVAACRLRGTPSYGFIVPLNAYEADLAHRGAIQAGVDMTSAFKAVKYEPPVRVYRGSGGGTGEVWGGLAQQPDNFHRYTDIQNFWKYHQAFTEGVPVRVTEKIHGVNSRVGLLRVDGEWNFHAGSHNTARKKIDPEGRESVYWYPLQQEGVLNLLTHVCDNWSNDGEPTNDVILFGELYGLGVQDLDYAVPAGEIGWRCYDCSVNGRYLDWSLLVSMCLFFGVPVVPVLYTGPYYAGLVDDLTNGPTTVVDPSTVKAKFRGREGIIITSLVETFSDVIGGRLILKSVSADYRDRKGAKDEGEL
jgi:RNA ligase (TIGR02306 family)